MALVTLGSASAEQPDSIHLASVLESGETDQKSIRLEVDPQAWHRLFLSGSARVSGFPLPGGKSADLTLSSFDLITTATRFVVSDSDGMHETTGPPVRFFRGTVDGDPDSVVSLTLFGGRIAGFMRTGGSEFTWHPRSFSPDAEGSQEILAFDDDELKAESSHCDGDELAAAREAILTDPPGPASTVIGPTTLLLASVAVEGTVEWVARHGGVSGAQLYTLNLLSQVSAVYEAEVSVQIQIPYVLMNAAEPDGYTGSSNSTSTILPEMRTKWNGSAALRGVFRSAVHLFGAYPTGGSGKAYRNVLCDNVPPSTASYDYAVSLLSGGGGSFERRLVAHELGHNFSSPHSHCYLPEIDRCNNTESGCYAGTVVQTTGTMMSYCNVRQTTFHERERGEKVRPGAEAAFPACMDIAGQPGEAAGLTVTPAPVCGSANLINDDGSSNGSQGYAGAARAAWVKRFVPGCHPFKLTAIDIRFSSPTVSPGRAIRLLVYDDPTGSGSIGNATLRHTQDVTVQVVGTWNHYTLSAPVIAASGDLYLGVFDLTADSASTYAMDYDTRTATDSWMQQDSTDVTTFTPLAGGTGSWMIRGSGGGVAAGSVRLDWDASCNEASVPGQDYAVYKGTFGAWSTYTSLTCTTGQARTWLIEAPPAGSFWLVVPQTSLSEGSYGRSSSGERPAAGQPCKPQAAAAACLP